MMAHAERCRPDEACGLLLGLPAIEQAVPTRNVAADPARRFEIDPAALIAAHRGERGGAARLAGYYHSHPSGSAEPSATDRASAAADGRVWAIVAGQEVRFWRDCPGGFEALPYGVVDN
jgi:desampylase